MQLDEQLGVAFDCVAALPTEEGVVYSLVVTTDGEGYFSTIVEQNHPASPPQTIYEQQGWLTALWRSQSGALFAVDVDGRLHTNEGGRWARRRITSGGERLNWLVGIGDNLVACGEAGTALRRSGRSWQAVGVVMPHDLNGVHGLDLEHLYAVGVEGTLLRIDAGRASAVPLPTNANLSAVLTRTGHEVCVVGENGAMFVGAGDRWAAIEEFDHDGYGLAEYGTGVAIAVGTNGVLVYDAGTVSTLKAGITANRIASSGRYLCAAGEHGYWRYDGAAWLQKTFDVEV